MAREGLFSKQVADWTARATKRSVDITKEACKEMTRRVVRRTPVKTGQARGNWNAGLNGPTQGWSSRRKDLRGDDTVERASAKIDKMKPGTAYYLSNSVPYIWRLENGWSKQAPNGMLRVTSVEWVNIVDQATKKVRNKR